MLTCYAEPYVPNGGLKVAVATVELASVKLTFVLRSAEIERLLCIEGRKPAAEQMEVLVAQGKTVSWSYDFVDACTHDGRTLRLLAVIDEFTRECLALRVARRLNSYHVIETLGDCMLQHGVPEHVRSDKGAEMTAKRVKNWVHTLGTKPLERGDFLFAEGSSGGDRDVAHVLQHDPPGTAR